MENESPRKRKLFLLFLGLVALALAGSLWAWVVPVHCGSCAGAALLLPGIRLAPVGVAFYLVLLLGGLLFGPTAFLGAGVSLAAAVHAVLIVLLASRSLFCGPCFLVGGAAILATALSFFIDPLNLGRASLAIPLGAIAAHLGLFSAGLVRLPTSLESPEVLAQAVERVPTPSGQARMVVYLRHGCPYCDLLERDVLPGLEAEFQGSLAVDRRAAPPGLPSPTIIVLGAARTVFRGLPEKEELGAAIVRALGGKADVSSVLPEPR